MNTDIRVKICGLREAATIKAAADAGAAYIGLNFFSKSPRSVTIAEAAALAIDAPAGLAKIGLVVNAEDAMLDAIMADVPLDMLQLHGTESPERVSAIKARFGLPVMKVVGVAGPEDLTRIDHYMNAADQILVDAKPPKGADLPGGNGVAFDWDLLAGRRWPLPWMLAGGLTAANVKDAITRTGARQVDTASGVETEPGMKDAGMIARFIEAARG